LARSTDLAEFELPGGNGGEEWGGGLLYSNGSSGKIKN